jgi:uncharacterized protein YueI
MKLLSVTLRDAQHLCWKTFKKLELMNKRNSAPTNTAMVLAQKAEDISQKTHIKKTECKDNAAKLLSELLYMTFVLAEQQGVDLEESFLQNIDDLILNSVT